MMGTVTMQYREQSRLIRVVKSCFNPAGICLFSHSQVTIQASCSYKTYKTALEYHHRPSVPGSFKMHMIAYNRLVGRGKQTLPRLIDLNSGHV